MAWKALELQEKIQVPPVRQAARTKADKKRVEKEK
jgi:hypothetical protein